jgi:hypothetical protein
MHFKDWRKPKLVYLRRETNTKEPVLNLNKITEKSNRKMVLPKSLRTS